VIRLSPRGAPRVFNSSLRPPSPPAFRFSSPSLHLTLSSHPQPSSPEPSIPHPTYPPLLSTYKRYTMARPKKIEGEPEGQLMSSADIIWMRDNVSLARRIVIPCLRLHQHQVTRSIHLMRWSSTTTPRAMAPFNVYIAAQQHHLFCELHCLSRDSTTGKATKTASRQFFQTCFSPGRNCQNNALHSPSMLSR
jgi:hypothetical protein